MTVDPLSQMSPEDQAAELRRRMGGTSLLGGSQSPDLLRRLAQMLRDVGFGSQALHRLGKSGTGRGPGGVAGGEGGGTGSGGSGFGLVVTPPLEP
jgi:hypothetical protein